MRDEYRLMAIIRNVRPQHILPIIETLVAEGVPSVEVSLSDSDKGFGCLEEIKRNFADDKLVLGAGTVSTPQQVDRLKDMGISFFVTPGFDGVLVDYAMQQGMEVIPGVLTPSDVQQVWNRGLSLAKLFPANAFSMGYVRDLKGPFPTMDFLAVGGVGPDNIGEYLEVGFCGVGIGSSLVPQGADLSCLEQIRSAAARCSAAIGK